MYFDKQIFAPFKLLMETLGVEEKEADLELEIFEQGVVLRTIDKLGQKLGEKEKKELVELANKVGEKRAEFSELNEAFKKLFNENEVKDAFKKCGDEFFGEVLREEYKKADEEQKKKLEEMFKGEALNG